MSRIRTSRPRDGAPAARQLVIDELGFANLGEVDLMRVRNQDDAERAIEAFRRRHVGLVYCTTASGSKIHVRRDRHHTMCGFKAGADLADVDPSQCCAMCASHATKEST